MRISKNWAEFMELMDVHYPRAGDTSMLPLDSAAGSCLFLWRGNVILRVADGEVNDELAELVRVAGTGRSL
jgi:hypothetical protein